METVVKVVTLFCILAATIRSVQGIVLAHYAIRRERKCPKEERLQPSPKPVQARIPSEPQHASQSEPKPFETVAALRVLGVIALWLLRDWLPELR
jgi:hypothetical protein